MHVLTQRQASQLARKIPFNPNEPPDYEVVDGLWRRVRKQLRHIQLRNSPMRKAHLQQQMGVLV